MARFSLDEGTSGSKRKKSGSEEEEWQKRKCGRSEGEASEPQDEEESNEVGVEVEVGYEVEDDEEMEKTCEEGGFSGGNRDGEFKFRIDPDVLDCSICFEPLRPPIFQCRDGHIACSDCCPKLLNKCHVCLEPIGRRRCIALEKVIESITSPCGFAFYGCRDILSFVNKASHEEICTHAALFCPISNCTFSGSKFSLFSHAQLSHRNISKRFSYDQPFKIFLEKEQPLKVLLGNDGHFFLLFNSHESFPGNVVSVICMASNNPKPEFSYELSVENEGSSLRLRSSPEKMKKWNGVHPCKGFLVVPDGFCASSSHLSIVACISKGCEASAGNVEWRSRWDASQSWNAELEPWPPIMPNLYFPNVTFSHRSLPNDPHPPQPSQTDPKSSGVQM